MIQGKVVSVWKKQRGQGKIIRGTGELPQLPVDFASVHTASKMSTLLVTACPGGRLHGIKSLGSLSSPAILKLKTIKIRVKENPGSLRNISIREQIPGAVNFSFYLLFTLRHVWAPEASTSDSPVVSPVHETSFNWEGTKKGKRKGVREQAYKSNENKNGCHFLYSLVNYHL